MANAAKALVPPIPMKGRWGDPAWTWAAYRPNAERPWDLRLAGHLYRRAAFGATWEQLQQALAQGPQASVDGLLHPQADIAAFNQAHDDYERAAARADSPLPASAWWLRRLLETPHPLLEKLTFFWHGFFALGTHSAGRPALICRYLQGLRRGALGRFDDLLAGVLAQPAAFAGTGARANRKTRPDPALSRILLEQYTVGPGRFSEADVQATACAFTGWFVSQEELRFNPLDHSEEAQTLFGQTGPIDADRARRILLAQPATAQNVVRRLYRSFIAETSTPPDVLVAPLAADFAKDYSVARVIETILRSNLFFSAAAYRQKVKSPVEFALGIIRPLGGPVPTLRLAAELADLGQSLYEPPTIRGWPDGRSWINRLTLVHRARLAQALVAQAGPYEGKLDPARTAIQLGDPSGRILLDLLLQGDLPAEAQREVLAENLDLRLQTGLIAALPEFQLS
jgi:uncharacterized protein (DUF1800 family)